ncbi:hypothetical protein C8J56DRAFT_883313 [Mycena floridula]|nr:hypothetical protein C8J56DRAFT_883313 [Mycena floridula]
MSGDSERTQSHDYYDIGNHRCLPSNRITPPDVVGIQRLKRSKLAATDLKSGFKFTVDMTSTEVDATIMAALPHFAEYHASKELEYPGYALCAKTSMGRRMEVISDGDMPDGEQIVLSCRPQSKSVKLPETVLYLCTTTSIKAKDLPLDKIKEEINVDNATAGQGTSQTEGSDNEDDSGYQGSDSGAEIEVPRQRSSCLSSPGPSSQNIVGSSHGYGAQEVEEEPFIYLAIENEFLLYFDTTRGRRVSQNESI